MSSASAQTRPYSHRERVTRGCVRVGREIQAAGCSGELQWEYHCAKCGGLTPELAATLWDANRPSVSQGGGVGATADRCSAEEISRLKLCNKCRGKGVPRTETCLSETARVCVQYCLFLAIGPQWLRVLFGAAQQVIAGGGAGTEHFRLAHFDSC